MKIKEMKQLVEEAQEYAETADAHYGDVVTADNALVLAQISIAKSLVVIATAMIEKQIRAELREELEEMRQERQGRNYGYGGLDS